MLRAPDGNDMTLKGIYREVDPPGRIVRTESCEFSSGFQTGEQLATLVLKESGEKTTLTLILAYPSKEARDAAVAAGAAKLDEAYERVDAILAETSIRA